MKKNKNQITWYRRLTVTTLTSLVLQILFPAGLVLAQAAPIGSLRAWENVITATSADLHFSFSSAGYFRIDYGTTAGAYPLSSSVSTLTNTSYPYYSIIVSGLTPNTTYYYRLATDALSPSTVEWGYTGESTFTTTTADTTPPTVSAVAASEVTGTSANITFTANESGYAKVEYGTGGTFGSVTSEINVTASSPTTIPLSGLTAGITYNYRLAARDNAGNSGTSASYAFTTTATLPATPTGLSTSGSTATTIGIYWADTASNETEFRIERRLNGSAWSQVGTVGINVTTYTDAISGAGTYEYRVKACNSAGCSTESNIVSRTMAATAPATPSGLSAAYNSAGSAVNVSWTDNSSDEWGFRLFRRVKGATAWFGLASVFNNSTSSNLVSYTDTYQLVANTTYEYMVRSYNTYESPDSNIVTAVPPGTTTTTQTTQTSPIGWWKFDGNGNNEVAGGPGAVTVGGVSFNSSGGAVGGYAYIPGSSDYLKVPYNSAFDLPNSFTVEFWFRQRADRSFFQDLVYKGSPTNNYNFRIFRQLWNQYNYGPIITGYTAQNTGYWSQTSNPNQLAHNVWHHVAYTKDSSGSAYYLDGALTHRLDTTQYTEYSGPARTPATDIIIGDSAVDTDIDNLKIYNRALSVSEVQQESGSYLPPADTTPPTVTGIYTGALTASSISVYFTLNEVGYAKVEYGPSSAFTLSTPEANIVPSVSSSIYLSGLTPGTNYSYRVAARDSANNSATSGIYTFTTTSTTTSTTATTTPSTLPTSDTTAPVISGVHVMTNTAAYTQIMWSTDDLSYGRVEYDSTTAYGAATSWTTSLSYSPAVDITGLAPGKTYHYRVRAKNAAGLESVFTTDYTFVAGGAGEPIPTLAFAVDPARTYPQTGSNNIPVATPKIQVEFTKAIDTASVTGGSVYLGFLGATTAASLSGKLDVFNNGFNFILAEPLKAGVSYNFTVRGTIRASSGESLGGDYNLTFTTAKATETTGQGVIKGTVKDSTGRPVAGAYVSLRTSAYGTSYGQSSQTTAYGEYNFTALAVGTYTLEVYPPASAGGFTRPAPVTVTLGSGETAIRDFTFDASNATIKGVVKFSDGTPVTDAEVSAYRREGSGWVSSPVSSDGSYSLIVQIGAWMVSIRPRYVPYATAASSYPIIGTGSSWVYTQPPQEVYIAAENDVRLIDFIVPKQTSTTSISGTLQRGDNEPIIAGSAFVRLLGQAGIALSAPVALGGRFTTPIAPGNYKLYVDVADPSLSSPEIPPVTIGPGEQKDLGLIIIPAATAVISGRVTTIDGRGVSGVKVSGWRANSADSAGAITDEQGNYTLKVSPGDWTVSLVSSPDQSYSNTAPPQFVRVKGGRVFGINFVLAPSDGLVNGLVTDEFGAILADFYGFVRVGSKNGFSLPGGSPVERGQFSLRLPAGNYILYMELPPNAGYGWPAPVPITVTTGESAKVVMKMATAAPSAVIGFLVDRAGNKITNVPFKVYATGSSGGWFSALIDMPLGYYKLKVPAGTWYIGYDVADSSGQYQRPRDAKKKITVAAGAIASLDLPVVEQNGRVNGVVRSSEGNSLANIWVAISGQPFSKFGRETAAAQRYLNGATSDEAGQFSLPVPSGTYYVRAFVPPSLGLTNPEEQTVRVAAGEEATVELVLRSIETTISGITTIAGVPNWAFVWAWSNKGGYTETYADEKGNFKLKVSSGDIWHVGAMSEIKRDTYKASELAINISRPGSSIPLSLDLAPLGVKLPELVNIAGEADQMTVAANDVGAKLVVPANAASTEGALAVSITPEVITPSQGADRVVGFGYEFDVRNAAGQEVNAFNSELTVSIPYDPRELSRLNLRPADLSLRYWDEINSTWQEVMNAIVDEINQVITGSLAHLTRFAIIAATDTTPPAEPAQVKAKIAGDGIVLTWVKPKDKDLQYVKIYRSIKKDALGDVVANNLSAATYKDSGLKRGATYYYLARAVDAAGNESTNTTAVAVAVKGSGTLGKAVARSVAAKVEKLNLKGSITDINLVASTMEIKDSRGQKTVVKFNPKTTFKKDGKAAKTTDVKVGNTIDAQATREAGVITLVSAVVTSVKVKVKAELKVSQFAGQRSKLKVKIIEARGVVAGVGIAKGQEAFLNIEGATVNANGKNTPVESLVPQKDVTIEGVIENGAVTVTKITAPPLPKVKVQPAPQGKIGDQAASVAR